LHGLDKSRLVVDGRPILERQLAMLASAVSEILIVTSEARAEAFAPGLLAAAADAAGCARIVRRVVDHYPGTGPLGAVVTAIDTASAATVVVLAADMPGVPRALIDALLVRHAAGGCDITVPESDRGLEPLCAVYGRSAREPLVAALAAGRLSLQEAIGAARLGRLPLDTVREFGDPRRMFRNINEPGDLQEPA
jgi:molybdopterin-guanine dinucleotide biosynthesis protein A